MIMHQIILYREYSRRQAGQEQDAEMVASSQVRSTLSRRHASAYAVPSTCNILCPLPGELLLTSQDPVKVVSSVNPSLLLCLPRFLYLIQRTFCVRSLSTGHCICLFHSLWTSRGELITSASPVYNQVKSQVTESLLLSYDEPEAVVFSYSFVYSTDIYLLSSCICQKLCWALG